MTVSKEELDVSVIKGFPKLISQTMSLVENLIQKLHQEHNWFPGGEEEIAKMDFDDKLQILNNIITEANQGSEHHKKILEELKVDPEFKVVMFNALVVGTSYMILNNTVKPKKEE